MKHIAILLALAASSAVAQTTRVLIGLPPGGSVEVTGRLYADKLRAALGHPVVVENRVGASGLIALDALKSSPADGSVLLFAPNGAITLIPQVLRKARFDPFKDVVPVARVAETDLVLAVNAQQVAAQTIAEFVSVARADQRYRSFGAAPAAIPHLAGALFGQAAKLELLHVPYKGAGQVVIDLIGGQLLGSVLTTGEGVPHARAGKLRLLASFGTARSPFMREVPTLREAGYPVEITSAWYAFYAPGGTPAAAIEPIARALAEASRAADLRDRLAQFGIEASAVTGADVLAQMRADYAVWTRAIAVAGIKPEE